MDLALTAVERAALAGGPPLDLTPATEPFDAKAELAWLKAHTSVRRDTVKDLAFDGVPFDGVPSPERAGFWLRFGRLRPRTDEKSRAMWAAMGHTGPLPAKMPTLKERLAAAADPSEPFDPASPGQHLDLPPAVLIGSWMSLGGPEFALRAALGHSGHYNDVPWLVPALRALVVPALSTRELPAGKDGAGRDLLHAALFGDEAEVRAALAGYAANFSHGTVALAPGLGALAALPDPAERLERGLALARKELGESTLARSWLAVLGPEALPALLEHLDGVDKLSAVAIGRMLLASLSGPGTVGAMLTLSTHPHAGPAATRWLAEHPAELAAATEPVPAAARDTLAAVVREVLAGDPHAYGDDVANPALRALLGGAPAPAAPAAAQVPDWFPRAAAAEAETPVAEGPLRVPAKPPVWATPAALPPLVVDGARLADEQAAAVLASAAAGANETSLAPRPLVAAARDRMTGPDRDALANALLGAFLANGGKPGDRAWFVAAGYLGADGFVAELTPLVREWPGRSQHQRAVLGLGVLAATGTAAALQSISGIANKSTFKAIQQAAREALARLAEQRGLTVHQLEDRVVPDGGLDARGTRELSFGPRRFRVTLTPQGKAVLRDLDEAGRPTGKPRAALPAPNAKDDAALAAAAKADFAVLRKQLTEIAKVQTARLENAMVTGRAWSAADHREFVVDHPVLRSLVAPLVWRVTDGAATTLVRVGAEGEYLTVDDATYVPPSGAAMALAHPLDLSEAERDAWRTHLREADLVAPLDQLDRDTHAAPAGTGTELPLPDGEIAPGTLASTLERMGWRRGTPGDGGVVERLVLPFDSRGVAAVLEISDGLFSGLVHESGPQRLDRLTLAPLAEADGDGGRQDWSAADPVLASEVLRAVDALAAKMT